MAKKSRPKDLTIIVRDGNQLRRTFMQTPNGNIIAYFTMEVGLSSEIPIYSGGLGILAADTLRAAADLGIPFVGVTLLNRRGYYKQSLTPEGKQIEELDEWDPSKYLTKLPTEVTVGLEGRSVKVGAWKLEVKGVDGSRVPLIFLDTNLDANTAIDREITSLLYGDDRAYRLKQEAILGIGGVRMLDTLGYSVKKYHMNEGHTSFVALELLRRYEMDAEAVRRRCVFTTHTPTNSAHDIFHYDLVKSILGDILPEEHLRRYGGHDALNMTLLGLNLSGFVNGVSKKHAEVSKQLFPNHDIKAITNGVHSYTWVCRSLRALYDKYLPGWSKEPELLSRVDIIPSDELWEAHMEAKKELIDFVNQKTSNNLTYDALTIGFARRATGYKRHTLVFSDLRRLKKIGKVNKLQIIMSGKAHLNDIYGKEMIEAVHRHMKELSGCIKTAYLENYNISIAAKMVAGCDVWLNTPLPPYEACGTSGMKAAHNGVLNFSVLDGWWLEGWVENVTGWAIGPHPDAQISAEERYMKELEDLYAKLEYIILPKYYKARGEWINMMKNSIKILAPRFNTNFMLHKYVVSAYLQ
ncbi:MAG: alpha-glucan family phosphorylase [Nitrososphaerales archaeon]